MSSKKNKKQNFNFYSLLKIRVTKDVLLPFICKLFRFISIQLVYTHFKVFIIIAATSYCCRFYFKLFFLLLLLLYYFSYFDTIIINKYIQTLYIWKIIRSHMHYPCQQFLSKKQFLSTKRFNELNEYGIAFLSIEYLRSGKNIPRIWYIQVETISINW